MTRKKTGQGILEGHNQVGELTHRLDVESMFALKKFLTCISMFVGLAGPGRPCSQRGFSEETPAHLLWPFCILLIPSKTGC